jgi:hypothetical protein
MRAAFHQLTSACDLPAPQLNAAGKEIAGKHIYVVPGLDQTEVERGQGFAL